MSMKDVNPAHQVAHVADPEHPAPCSPKAPSKRSLPADTFIFELLAALLSLLCMSIIAILLWRYNGRPLSDWPLGITLNALVSVLSTVAKSALAMGVSAGLSQGKWVWFSRERRQLGEVELFDRASRGPLGGVQLLWLTRGRHLASLGAFVTIMSVAVGPLVQQVISLRGFAVGLPGSTEAVVPFTEHYSMGSEIIQAASIDSRNGNNFAFAFTHLDFSMASAIYKGLTSSQDTLLQDLSLTCPTGNCTWPVFPSLAICSQCHDVTPLLTKSSGIDVPIAIGGSDQNLGSSPQNVTTYTLPNGMFINGVNGFFKGYPNLGLAAVMTAKFTMQPSTTMNFKGNDVMLFSISTIRADVAYERNRTAWEDSSPTAAECALYYCINAYNTSITNGGISEEVVATWSTKTPSSWQLLPLSEQPLVTNITNGDFSDLADSDGLTGDPNQGYLNRTDLQLQNPTKEEMKKYRFPPNANFSISQPSVDSIAKFLKTLFISTKNISDSDFTGLAITDVFNGRNEYSPDVMQILHNTSDGSPFSIPSLFANLARSMTNSLRNSPTAGTHRGTVFEIVTQFHVRWPWIVFPVSIVVLGCVFLVCAVWQTRSAGAAVWKGSSLAALWHGFDAKVSESVGKVTEVGEMRRKAERVKVRLMETEEGIKLAL